MFDFVNITFVDILDIALVAGLIYWIVKLVRGTNATKIFGGIIGIYIIWIVARLFEMKLLSFILGQLLGVGVIALLIIFQPEIRRFLLRFGARGTTMSSRIVHRIFKSGKTQEMTDESLDGVVVACQHMSGTRTGALMVMRKYDGLAQYIQTGDLITAEINSRLIENIFFKNTPLHDGAVIMSADKILAARCTLPITENENIPPRFGMRHRAAIGITEVSDAAAIVVSEETGEIHFVEDGTLELMNSAIDLKLALDNFYRK